MNAYPLRLLTPLLAQKKAAAQAELARLAPLIAAAEADRAARVAAEESARLAFLDVVPADDLYPSLQFNYAQARAATKNANDDCRYLLDQCHAVTGGDFYFQDLPPPAATAETNAQGAFDLDLPPGGPFAIAASVRQATDEGPPMRYWMVKASLADENPKPLLLTDANCTSTTSAESLVHTED